LRCCKADTAVWCEKERVIYKDSKGKEYCVFHAPRGKKGVTVQQFNQLVFSRIKGTKNGEICDLSQTVFEGNIDFKELNGDGLLPAINFSEAIFTKKTDFSYITFGRDPDLFTYFLRTTFCEEAYFINTIFHKTEVTFREATFTRRAYFSGTKFYRGANFQGATFKGKAYLSDVEFNREANFSKTTYMGWTDFSRAKFYGETDFTRVIFFDETLFLRVTFYKKVDFSGATFKRAFFFDKTFIEDADFQLVNIKEEITFEKVNLRKISFLDTDLRRIDFINCTWHQKYGRYVLYDELRLFQEITDKDEEAKKLLHRLKQRFKGSLSGILKREWSGFKKDISFDQQKIKKVEILYRRLKQKYKEERDEPMVSIWHYGEKEMFRKGSLKRRFNPVSLSNLYWLSSGYGESSRRSAMVLLLLIFAVSILLALSGLVPLKGGSIYGIERIKGLADIIDFRKFGMCIISTLQYATFERQPYLIPETLLGECLKLLARILIPLQTALFALAVRNQLRR